MQEQNLVSHEEKALLGCKSDDILNALPALDLTCQQQGVRLEKIIQRTSMFICCHLVATIQDSEVTALIAEERPCVRSVCLTSKPDVTGGVSRVYDAQGSGVAVCPGLIQGTLQLTDVQTPALLFIQVIVDLHRSQFCQSSRVQWILGNGDHDACTGRTLAAHEQF